jgi:hypothetical protein
VEYDRPVIQAKPVDALRNLAAPRDLIEWVRKLPPEAAARSSWVDATRADWMPYLAAMRGIGSEAILRAVCECAVETAGALEGPEGERVLGVLRDCAARGKAALATTETDLADLKLTIIQSGHNTTSAVARPVWMYWAELVLELARAASRGNVLVGISLAARLLAGANTITKPTARPAHLDLVARLREKLTLAG